MLYFYLLRGIVMKDKRDLTSGQENLVEEQDKKKPTENKNLSIEEKQTENDTIEKQTDKELTSMQDNTKEQAEDKPLSRKAQFLQFLKFLGFSLSAGVIQLLSFELLYTWTACLPWWPAYLISIVLSVIWNFTFNRHYTFKSASNVPLAMTIVLIYYCMFIPVSVFGGDALEGIGWNGTLVTVLMMVLNFITEFFWDKYIVFNDKLLAKLFKKKMAESKTVTENAKQSANSEVIQSTSSEENMQSAENTPLENGNNDNKYNDTKNFVCKLND